MADICVILQSSKDLGKLVEQINSISNQSLLPSRLILWNTSNSPIRINTLPFKTTSVHIAGDHAPSAIFTSPLLLTHDFYCIVNEYTLPERWWLSSCMQQYECERSLIGKGGYLYRRDPSGSSLLELVTSSIGMLKQVDFISDCYFFDRGMIEAFWSLPFLDRLPGESPEIHFSFAVQSILGLRTVVPPLPIVHNEDVKSLNPFSTGDIEHGDSNFKPTWSRIMSEYSKCGFRLSL